jgi:cytochrome P450
VSTLPPGPRGYPLLGMLPQLRADPVRTFLDAADRYGDVVHIKAGKYHGYLVCAPADIKHVLQDNYRNYHKSPLYDRLKHGIGDGLLTSEDAVWLRQRRLAQPAFHRERLAAMCDVMADCTEQLLAQWEAVAARGETLELVSEMMHLTQRIIVRTMFSTDLGSAAETVNRTWPVINKRIGETFWSTPLETSLPLPANRRFRRALAELETVVYRIIAERRQSPGDTRDLLSMLLAARDEDTGEQMTDRQLRDEVMTMLLAGHETTSVALSWTYFLLWQHPNADERLAAEAVEVLGDRRAAFGDTERLHFTRMVLHESLRLYPPAWGFSRLALGDDRISGYGVGAGSLVFVIPFVVHRRPALWPDPERFDPERFVPDRIAERPRFAFLPFGGGPRGCIGSNFAMIEAQVILAMIARRYRIEVVPGTRVEPLALITLRPSSGIPVRLVPRRKKH